MGVMKFALYVKNPGLNGNPRLDRLLDTLKNHTIYYIVSDSDIQPDTDMILSIGGDGTFLSASSMASPRGIPVLGVNFGRLGFLSEYSPEDVSEALNKMEYDIESREILQAITSDGKRRYALNEVVVGRLGAAMLGVDVEVDGVSLPTYWADGLLVATSSGSTAYSLSVGGPICTPDSKVLIISPVAPHNLNVRPLIVPSSAKLSISVRSRNDSITLSCDNYNEEMPRDSLVTVEVAQFSLKRVRLSKTNFIAALKSKLFWGEDVRNSQ